MQTVTVTTLLPASPDQVWSAIGDPGAISSWHPAIAESSLNGNDRVCTLGDGARIDEQIDQVDNAGRSYSYRIVASPLPIENYQSTIKVVDSDGGCNVEWTSTFDVVGAPEDEIAEMIRGLYEAGMGAIRDQFPG